MLDTNAFEVCGKMGEPVVTEGIRVGRQEALLIAAAPDLLEALEEVREELAGRSDVVDGSYGEPAPNWAMSLLTQVDAAIAKARGLMP